MINILDDKCIHNIFGHIKNRWDSNSPTGKNLENAIFDGLVPFYSNAQLLGSPDTIVDVGKDLDAFDIKGSQSIDHQYKIVKSSNFKKNNFITQTLPNGENIIVKIPKSIITQVRRPKVNLEGYKGDPKTILDFQIDDYINFARTSTVKKGYKDLYSLVLLYGEDKGVKSIFFTLKEFENPIIVDYRIRNNNVYEAIDQFGDVAFKVSSFNAGSSNFYKKFDTSKGILMSWINKENTLPVFTLNDLEKDCIIDGVNLT